MGSTSFVGFSYPNLLLVFLKILSKKVRFCTRFCSHKNCPKGGGIASSSFILFFYLLYWYSYIVYFVCAPASEFGAMGSTSFLGFSNLGSPGPLYDKATQGCQSESCLGGWRCKDPSEEVDRRRRGWTASRKISRPSARSRARAKDGSGSHSELLSRMDGTG